MWQHALLGNYRQQEAKRYSGKISFKVPSLWDTYWLSNSDDKDRAVVLPTERMCDF